MHWDLKQGLELPCAAWGEIAVDKTVCLHESWPQSSIQLLREILEAAVMVSADVDCSGVMQQCCPPR